MPREDGLSLATAPVLISVVIPKRDRCELTLRALLSALRQTHSALDIIIIDDASTEDDTPLQRFIANKPVRLIRVERHCGAAEARNRGIDAARGEYIAFLDSDDYWLPDKLQHQLAIIQKLTEPCVLTGALAYTKRSQIYLCRYPQLSPGMPIEDYLYRHFGVLQTTTFMMSAAVARRVRFDATLPVHQDTDFMLRAAASGIDVHFDEKLVGIIDAGTSHPRITNNADHLEDSMTWFRLRSANWKESTRRAFLRHDYANRCGRSGRRLLGFRYFLGSPIERPWSIKEELRTMTLLLLGMPLMEFLRERLAPLRARFRGNNRPAAAPVFASFHADAALARELMQASRSE